MAEGPHLSNDDWGAATADAEIDPNDVPIPHSYRILLRPRPPKDSVTMKGGHKLYLPDQAKEAETFHTSVAEVVALGPRAYKDEKTGYAKWYATGPEVKPGDYVLIDKYAGKRVEYKGVRFLIVQDDMLLGVVKDWDGVKGYV